MSFVSLLALLIISCFSSGEGRHVEFGHTMASRSFRKAGAGQLATLSVANDPIKSATTTHQNWFERLKSSIASVVIGIVLCIFSIPIMWMNERRAARYESLIAVGKKECKSLEPGKSDPSNRGVLVHMQGATAHGEVEVKDRRFADFNVHDGCLRLRTTVEAYQWVEHSHSETKKDNVGGGSTTTTTYSYNQEWVSYEVNSGSFNDRSYTNHMAKPGFRLGSETADCSLVYYGDSYVLPMDLVAQLGNFQDASKLVGDEIDGFVRKIGCDKEHYYFPEEAAGRCQHPNTGDMRVKFSWVPDCEATVFALQAESKTSTRDSFLPYRMISRGLCGVNEDEQKRRQIFEARKTADELYEADKCSCGPLNGLFCCCMCVLNCVSFCFSAAAPPQVYCLLHGSVSLSACWEKVELVANAQKNCIRFVAWAMLLIGLMLQLAPIFTVIDIIPFVGPTLSNILWLAVFLVAVVLTLVIATLVMSLAYLVYRPMIGIMYLFLTATVVAAATAFRASQSVGKVA